ncbi:MAG TPA: M1 family metallopeptidase [Spirochaetia bacterium]|nr:M1 family metallopeptidase [Spirochaetia bacterium]
MSKNDASRYQLPRTVMPRHYDITVKPDFTSFRFDGTVCIDLDVRTPVDRIVAHALGLEILRAHVTSSDGVRHDAVTVPSVLKLVDPVTAETTEHPYQGAAVIDEAAQTATFSFGARLPRGSWKLVVEYRGSLVQPSLEGFYRSRWTDAGGAEHWILSTQFEATHARRAFPCWDEPAVKATYAVTLVVDRALTALSNMRAGRETVDGAQKTISFLPTPRMSTYLVAWCIGDLESSPPAMANGKELRIWSVPGKNALKGYALRCAKFGVEWYERTLGVAYFGGDKIDMVAIPEFRSGAMENTGLITYRATALLVDEARATVAELQRVAEVVTHELAHMWFGNLVTMAWWDGLPLNESNATIFAYLVMADFEPEWKIFNSFGLKRAAAFALDSLNSTHPCWAPVGHPDEVEQRFDRITYEKGGSVEFQLHQFVGDGPFYAGATTYLKRYDHGNAEVTDLWDALQAGAQASGLRLPVRRIMDAWFLTDGHPLVTVAPGRGPGFVTLTQERFAFLPRPEHARQAWPVPLQLRVAAADGSVRTEKVLFSGRRQEVKVGEGARWVVANAGGSGFYRVRYSPDLLASLLESPFERLEVIERFNLVNDSWALVRAGKMGADAYLDLVRKLSEERDPSVWSIIGGSLQALHTLTAGDERAAFEKLIRELVRPVFNRLGWAPQATESTATRELRGSLAGLLGTAAEDAEVRSTAAAMFESWKANRASVDPNVVPALVSTLATMGDAARYQEFLALSRSAPTDQEKLRFLRALGEFRVPELYSAAIRMMLTEVKPDEAPFILGSYLGLEHAGPAAWAAIKESWSTVAKKFPTSATVRMIEGCSALDTPELAADVEEFFARTPVAQGEMAVAQMRERLSVNVRLRRTETPRLADYLTRNR